MGRGQKLRKTKETSGLERLLTGVPDLFLGDSKGHHINQSILYHL